MKYEKYSHEIDQKHTSKQTAVNVITIVNSHSFSRHISTRFTNYCCRCW